MLVIFDAEERRFNYKSNWRKFLDKIWTTNSYRDIESSNGEAILFANSNGSTSLTLTEDTTLNMQGLSNGSQGNIIIEQGAIDYTLTITPTPYVIDDGAGEITLSSGPGAYTVLSYSYTGDKLFMNYGLNYTNA